MSGASRGLTAAWYAAPRTHPERAASPSQRAVPADGDLERPRSNLCDLCGARLLATCCDTPRKRIVTLTLRAEAHDQVSPLLTPAFATRPPDICYRPPDIRQAYSLGETGAGSQAADDHASGPSNACQGSSVRRRPRLPSHHAHASMPRRVSLCAPRAAAPALAVVGTPCVTFHVGFSTESGADLCRGEAVGGSTKRVADLYGVAWDARNRRI